MDVVDDLMLYAQAMSDSGMDKEATTILAASITILICSISDSLEMSKDDYASIGDLAQKTVPSLVSIMNENSFDMSSDIVMTKTTLPRKSTIESLIFKIQSIIDSFYSSRVLLR